MSVIRKAKKSRYTAITNKLAQDSRLTFESRGVMLYLLSKPDDWEVQFHNVEKEGKIGRDKRQRIFAELELYGYFTREESRSESGHFGYDYIVHEEPLPENPVAGMIPLPDLPEPDLPVPENTVAVNILQIPDSEQIPEEQKEQDINSILKRVFPELHPSPFQLDQLYTLVTDIEVFEAACVKWGLSGWRGRNIAGLLELYDRLVAEKVNPTTQLSPTPVVIEDECAYCTGPMQCPVHGGVNV